MKTLAAAFISMLLLSLVAGTLLVNLATANAIFYGYFPTEPITTPPTIIVHSPTQNQTCNSTDVWLNFTVVKPEAWIGLTEVAHDENHNPSYPIFGNVISVYYVLDGGERQSIPVHDISDLVEAFPKHTLDFSVNLTLAEGAHNITVGVDGESFYVAYAGWAGGHMSSPVHGESELINFTVTEPELGPEPETFPTTLLAAASGASLAAVSIGLAVYLKKRKH